jgi:2'-hydroxyisoflavone reductase
VLAAGSWDVVIDTSAYVPRQVKAIAQALQGRVGQYQLVSTISVYADFSAPDTDETAPLAVLEDPTTEAVSGPTYGGLKVLCEQAAEAGFAGRCLISRPGLIVGPHDPTGRFTWWVQRVARGGDVLAPGSPEYRVQFIDARDLAAWHLLQAERCSTGVFNVTGPVGDEDEAAGVAMGELLNTAAQTLQVQASFRWIHEQSLLMQGVSPWTELPLWLPRTQAGMHSVDVARARAAGLRTRPLAQTVADTAAWAAQAPPPALGGPMRPVVGISPEREAALLDLWKPR